MTPPVKKQARKRVGATRRRAAVPREIPPDIHQRVLARSWTDPGFRLLMLTDPHRALKKMGFDVPKGVRVNVTSQPGAVLNLQVPEHPAGAGVTPGVGGPPLREPPTTTSYGDACGLWCTLTLECGCPGLTRSCPW